MNLLQHIESLIFATQEPIALLEISQCLEAVLGQKIIQEDILAGIAQLQDRYKQEHFAIEIVEIAGGYQFLTKGAYHNTIGTHLKLTTKKRLSRSAMETLSIIAYKQPVTKGDLEKIRGVGCDYALQKLLEKELITIIGRSDAPGRPLLYSTSEKFMNYFGLKNLKDLPKPKDFKNPDSEIGERQE